MSKYLVQNSMWDFNNWLRQFQDQIFKKFEMPETDADAANWVSSFTTFDDSLSIGLQSIDLFIAKKLEIKTINLSAKTK